MSNPSLTSILQGDVTGAITAGDVLQGDAGGNPIFAASGNPPPPSGLVWTIREPVADSWGEQGGAVVIALTNALFSGTASPTGPASLGTLTADIAGGTLNVAWDAGDDLNLEIIEIAGLVLTPTSPAPVSADFAQGTTVAAVASALPWPYVITDNS